MANFEERWAKKKRAESGQSPQDALVEDDLRPSSREDDKALKHLLNRLPKSFLNQDPKAQAMAAAEFKNQARSDMKDSKQSESDGNALQDIFESARKGVTGSAPKYLKPETIPTRSPEEVEASGEDPNRRILLNGWESATDPNSKLVYYFNRATGERQWEYPEQASFSSEPLQGDIHEARGDPEILNMLKQGRGGLPIDLGIGEEFVPFQKRRKLEEEDKRAKELDFQSKRAGESLENSPDVAWESLDNDTNQDVTVWWQMPDGSAVEQGYRKQKLAPDEETPERPIRPSLYHEICVKYPSLHANWTKPVTPCLNDVERIVVEKNDVIRCRRRFSALFPMGFLNLKVSDIIGKYVLPEAPSFSTTTEEPEYQPWGELGVEIPTIPPPSMRRTGEHLMPKSRNTVVKLIVAEPEPLGKHRNYFIPGLLYGLAFVLTLIRLKKIHSFPLQQSQESLMEK